MTPSTNSAHPPLNPTPQTPAAHQPPTLNPTVERWIDDLLARMTLTEKVGQMTQAEKNSVKPGDVARLGLGSVLSGGGGNPDPNTPQAWREMVSAFLDEAQQSRLKIPLLYGSDAVHGHNNVVGATIFPHNIGLGCTRDPELLRRIGRVTALEAAATDVRWAFAPAVSISQDFRWGRSFESYGQEPALVGELASALIEELRGDAWNDPTAVLPSVKHFVADGATTWGSGNRARMAQLEYDTTLALTGKNSEFAGLLALGAWQIDQGDSVISEAELREIHLAPYRDAVRAGALNVMVSYSSWHGLKMHAQHELITGVLKGELGFTGFVVSDWEGVQQLSPDFETAVRLGVNAGLDMVMVPFEYERFMDTLRGAVEAGDVPTERIDDAVRRILRVKHTLGLFEQPHTDPALLSQVGSAPHRALAREAAAKSAVLFKNEGVFPVAAGTRLLVAGEAADDLGTQCGGWTISWMGAKGRTTPGTTLLEGLQTYLDPDALRYEAQAEGEERFDLGVVVLAEEPYAEGMGDRMALALTDADRALVARVRARCERVAVVLFSGRPLIITDELPGWDAFVAAWLPGTEGAGLAEVLLGYRPFQGCLSFDWPRRMSDLPRRPSSETLFQVGSGQVSSDLSVPQ